MGRGKAKTAKTIDYTTRGTYENLAAALNENKEPQRWDHLRRRMMDEQIRPRGVCDERVLDVMGWIPRERFVPSDSRNAAYEDRPLPIGQGQTISQPFIVAYMTEHLAVPPDGRILEIGTGVGYQTAILACLAGQVFTVDRLPSMTARATENLAAISITNVTLLTADGSLGLAAHAPYDRIMVTAAAPRIPPDLTNQLGEGGRLIIPIGGPKRQTIVEVVRRREKLLQTSLLACRFVKLFGHAGWAVQPPDA